MQPVEAGVGARIVMCNQCEKQAEADRVFWLAVRRALLALVKAVEVRHGLGTQDHQDKRAA